MRRGVSSAASAGLALALAGVAFGARGGSDLARATTVELALVIVGGLVVAASVVWGRTDRLHGAPAVALLLLLACLSALSIVWSIQPASSWVETNRLLAYLAVFATSVCAVRAFPCAWPTVLRGICGAAAVVVGYALLSRIFPEAIAPDELYARLSQPFDYWNALGASAAVAVPPTLWLGARRSGHPPANALAYPLMGMLLVAMFLAESRGALIAAGAGAALWVWLVPLRLRSLAVLGVAAAGAAPVVAWALSRDAFSANLADLALRKDAAPAFALLLALMLGLLLAAGLLLHFHLASRPPAPELRRRAGMFAGGAGAVLAVTGAAALALTGPSDRIDDLASETATTPGGAGRLATTSSSRGRYWRQAGSIFADNPAIGTGAGTYGLARLRYRKDDQLARHAHGFLPQTMADLGLAGMLLALLLGAAWLYAVFRTVGLRPRERRILWDADRIGYAALALTAVVFGIHSLFDFTWWIHGPAVTALVAAGFAAGRGPLAVLGEPPPERTRLRWPLPRPREERVLAGAGVLLVTFVVAWAMWQPERSEDASDEALAALERGDLRGAVDSAQKARDRNRLSPRPFYVRAYIEDAAGRPEEARATLQRAVREFPTDVDPWLRLADFQLYRLQQPQEALNTLRGALYLDPRSREAKGVQHEARLSVPPAG